MTACPRISDIGELRSGGTIPPAVVAAFRCSVCHQKATTDAAGLRCTSGHLTPWRDGYLDAVADAVPVDATTKRTFESFGYEWTRFSQVNAEDRSFWARYFADVDLSLLHGRLGLDAGCGKGRFSQFTAAHVGTLVASDGS